MDKKLVLLIYTTQNSLDSLFISYFPSGQSWLCVCKVKVDTSENEQKLEQFIQHKQVTQEQRETDK